MQAAASKSDKAQKQNGDGDFRAGLTDGFHQFFKLVVIHARIASKSSPETIVVFWSSESS